MHKVYYLFLSLILISCSSKKQADLIIYNADIYTVDSANPTADVLVIQDNKFLAVGNSELLDDYESGELIDVEGAFILPGFIDTHVHFMDGGSGLFSVKLRDASSPEEFIQRIADYVQTVPEGTWITGGDWDHEMWGGELPQRDWIDSVSSGHPIMVSRMDGHMALVNSKAMELAEIGDDIGDVGGGEIVRLDGRPTGIFKDNAMNFFYPAIDEPDMDTKQKYLKGAMEYVNRNGVTSVHHMGSWGHYETFQIAHEKQELSVRIYSAVPLQTYAKLADRIDSLGKGDEWLKIGGLKSMVDGSLGSHTAVFLDPYTDQPDYSGIYIIAPPQHKKLLESASDKGLHIITHAIGDKAIQELLNNYEDISKQNPDLDYRFRIEHAQHLDPSDLKRFREIGVIASMQPFHAIDDGRWAERVIGKERAKYTYAFKSLLKESAHVSFGSDWPVAPATPLEGIYAAATRRTFDGANPNGWMPDQKISVEEAIRSYTLEGAYASFEENEKGSLSPGKFADFIILEKNITQIDPVTIPDVRVLATYVGGKKVFELNE